MVSCLLKGIVDVPGRNATPVGVIEDTLAQAVEPCRGSTHLFALLAAHGPIHPFARLVPIGKDVFPAEQGNHHGIIGEDLGRNRGCHGAILPQRQSAPAHGRAGAYTPRS